MRNELITKINEIIDENKELKARNDYLEAYKRRSEKACNVATESITEIDRKLIEIGKKKLLEEVLWYYSEVRAFRNEETKEIEITPYETWIDNKINRGCIPNNMSQEELAERTNFSPKYVSEVVNGKKRISANFAKGLEYVFGINTTFWLNLQSIYDKELLETLKVVSKKCK